MAGGAGVSDGLLLRVVHQGEHVRPRSCVGSNVALGGSNPCRCPAPNRMRGQADKLRDGIELQQARSAPEHDVPRTSRTTYQPVFGVPCSQH